MKKKNLLLRLIRNILVGYGCVLPDHPGKWPMIKRLSKSMRLHKVIPCEVTVVRNGITYRLDLTDAMDRILYYRGVHERHETKLCRRMIRPGFTCLDAGANMGYYTLLFAQLAGAGGRVHAFEPCPEEAGRLLKNVSLNGFDSVKIHPVALCNFTGKVGITERRKGGNTRIAVSNEESRRKIDCLTLDEFAAAERLTRMDLIKMDVEGMEVRLLEGGAKAISRFKPVMIIELNPGALRRFGNRVAEITAFCDTHRYALNTVTSGGVKRFERMPDTAHINVVAFPKDRIPWKQVA